MAVFFDGLTLFGLVMSCRTTAAGQQRQVNAYPGVNNLEVLNMGTRGGHTELIFLLTAPDLPSLAVEEGLVVAYQIDGGGYTFIDTMGVVYTGVILENAGPAGDIDPLADGSGYGRVWRASLLHTR